MKTAKKKKNRNIRTLVSKGYGNSYDVIVQEQKLFGWKTIDETGFYVDSSSEVEEMAESVRQRYL